MKIFDWLHRRLCTRVEYCRVPHDHKKDVYVDDGSSAGHGIKKAGTEKGALLLDPNVTSIQHVLDGILTIGTLGHLDDQCHQESLTAAVVLHEFTSDSSASREEDKEEVPVDQVPCIEHRNQYLATESFRKEIPAVDVGNVQVENIADDEEDLLEPLLPLWEIEADKRERVTLADLLAVEHFQSGKPNPTRLTALASAKTALEKVVNGAAETTVVAASLSCTAKHNLALDKKPVHGKKGREYSSPAPKKLHQRIRRMLKKKVHPEMARDMQACDEAQGSHRNCTGGSTSLI